MWYFVLQHIACPESNIDLKSYSCNIYLTRISSRGKCVQSREFEAICVCVFLGVQRLDKLWWIWYSSVMSDCKMSVGVWWCFSTVWWFGSVPKPWIRLTEPHQKIANFHPHSLQVTLSYYMSLTMCESFSHCYIAALFMSLLLSPDVFL